MPTPSVVAPRPLGLLVPATGIGFDLYQRAIYQEVQRLAGPESPVPLLAITVRDSEELLREEKWWTLTEQLKRQGQNLALGGAEGFILGEFTWHRFSADITAAVPIPLLDPFDALEPALASLPALAVGPIGFLGPALATFPGAILDRLTATGRDLYFPALTNAAAIDALIAGLNARTVENENASRDSVEFMRRLGEAGARSVLIGSEALSAVIQESDCPTPWVSLPELYAAAAARWMLGPRT